MNLRAPAAALALLGSAAALTLNAPAPAFTLPDGPGEAFTLADHLGRERLLVVPRPPAAYLEGVRRQSVTLRAYDLRVVALLSPGDPQLGRPRNAALTVLSDPGGRVAARYGHPALIGKDGGVKALYPAPPPLDEVLGLIDTMPMRQQEKRVRGR